MARYLFFFVLLRIYPKATEIATNCIRSDGMMAVIAFMANIYNNANFIGLLRHHGRPHPHTHKGQGVFGRECHLFMFWTLFDLTTRRGLRLLWSSCTIMQRTLF